MADCKARLFLKCSFKNLIMNEELVKARIGDVLCPIYSSQVDWALAKHCFLAVKYALINAK